MSKTGPNQAHGEIDLSCEILARIDYWRTLPGTRQQKLRMVRDDPQWMCLMRMELALTPLTVASRDIRLAIASLEPCHEHYVENARSLIRMIGQLRPGPLVSCGQTCGSVRVEAASYAAALSNWLSGTDMGDDSSVYTREVFGLLGAPLGRKPELVRHVIAKLRDGAYDVPVPAGNGDCIEMRIQNLAICNFNWRHNLRIVLREIAANRRLFDWHTPEGFNAHGDCPDRTRQLTVMLQCACSWCQGELSAAGYVGEVLGQPSAVKTWLAASLLKMVASQHTPWDPFHEMPWPELEDSQLLVAD